MLLGEVEHAIQRHSSWDPCHGNSRVRHIDGESRAGAFDASATIVDGLSDAPLRDRSLLIEGNTIRDTLPADAPTPVGAQVLDLSGKFIIPGLFDSHVHSLLSGSLRVVFQVRPAI